MAGHDTELKPVGRFGNTTHLLVLAAAQQIPRILVGRGHTPHARPSILLRCTPKTKIAYCPMPTCVALTQMIQETNTTHLKNTRNQKTQNEKVSVFNGTYTFWRRLCAHLSPDVHVQAAIPLVGVPDRHLVPSGRNTNKTGTMTLRYPPPPPNWRGAPRTIRLH